MVIDAATVGKYDIELSKQDGSLAARTTVECTDTPYHPWMPWGRQLKATELILDAIKGNGKDVMHAIVSNRADGIALPHWDGSDPIIVESQDRRLSNTERLPTTFPLNSDASFKLGVDGNLVAAIESDNDFLICRPDWHFLTRWWVNGKPYVPAQMKPEGDDNGLVVEGRKLHLHLEFEPARIGAKKGDQIGLQLLYCRNGWNLVLDGESRAMAIMEHDGKMPFRLSNRVEFAAP